MGAITGSTFSITKYIARFKKNDSSEPKTFKATFNAEDGSHVFTITQEGKETVVKDFKWSNGNTSIDKEVEFTTKSVQESYTMIGYTLSDLTVTCNTSGCSGRLDSSGVFIGNITTNSDTQQRDIVFNVVYNGETIATLTVKQSGKPEDKYFWLGESGKTIYTTEPALDATATTVTVPYLTNYTQEELAQLTSATTFSWIKSLTLAGGNVTVTIDANTDILPKNGFVHIKKNGYINLGTINIKQNAADKRFTWDNGQSAKTLSNFTETRFTEAYTTNYNSLTVEYTDNVSTATLSNVNGSGTANGSVNPNQETTAVTSYVRVKSNGVLIGELTIVQPAAEGKYFWVNAEGTKDYEIPEFEATVSCAQTPYRVTIGTNYLRSDVKFSFRGFLNSVDLTEFNNNTGETLFTFDANDGSDRTAKISFYTGNTLTDASTLGSILISQKGVATKEFAWRSDEYDISSLDITVLATATTTAVTYYSTYPEDLSIESDYYGVVVTGFSPTALTTTTEQVKPLTINFTENISTTSSQVDYIRVRDANNNVVGTIKLTQMPKENVTDWFKWIVDNMDKGEIYTVPETFPKEGGEGYKYQFITNVDGLSFVPDDRTVFTEQPNQVIEGPGTPEEKRYCKFGLDANTGEDNRTVVISVKKDGNNQTIGKLIFTQEGTPAAKYVWIETEGNKVKNDDNVSGAAVIPVYTILTNYTVQQLNAFYKSVNVNWISNVTFGKNGNNFFLQCEISQNDGEPRNGTILIKETENSEDFLIQVNITQKTYVSNSFKWDDGTTNRTIEIEATATTASVSVAYTNTYPDLKLQPSTPQNPPVTAVGITSTDGDGVFTADTSENTDTVNYRTAIYYVYTGSTYTAQSRVGQITIRQKPKSIVKSWKLKYGTQEGDTINIDSIPAVLDNERTFTVTIVNDGYERSVYNYNLIFNTGDGWVRNPNITNDFKLIFSVDDNTSSEIRSAYIEVINSEAQQTKRVNISQFGSGPSFEWTAGQIDSSNKMHCSATTSEYAGFVNGGAITFKTNLDSNGFSLTKSDGWITSVLFNQYDGKNVSVKVQVEANPETRKRSGYVYLNTNSTLGQAIIYVEQSPKSLEKAFKWENGGTTSTLTISKPWNNPTGATELFYNSFTDLNYNYYQGDQFATLSQRNDGTTTEGVKKGHFNVTCQPYTAETNQNRQEQFQIICENNTRGYLTIVQIPSPYFKWTANDITLNSGQSGGTITLDKNGVSNKDLSFKTNITNLQYNVISGTDFLSGKNIIQGSPNGAFRVTCAKNEEIRGKSVKFSIIGTYQGETITAGTIEVNQTKADAVFKWNNNNQQAATATTDWNVGTAVCGFTTNYSGLTVAVVSNPDNWCSTSSPNNSNGNGNFSASYSNTYDSMKERIASFNIIGKDGDNISYTAGTITVKQNGRPGYFIWQNTTNNSFTKTDIAADSTSFSTGYTTNYSGLTVSIPSGAWVSVSHPNNEDGAGSFSSSFAANTDQRARSNVTMTIKGKDQNGNTSDIGTITLGQKGAAPFFRWGTVGSTTSTAITINYDATSASKEYQTNYSGLTATKSEGDSYLTTGFTSTEFTGSTVANTKTSKKEAKYIIKGNGATSSNQEIGDITITQKGAPISFKWKSGSEESTTSAVTASSNSYYCTYTSNCADVTSELVLSANSRDVSFGWDVNNNKVTGTTPTNETLTAKTYEIYVKTGTTSYSKIATLTVTVPAANPYFYWTDTGTSNSSGGTTGYTATTITCTFRSNYSNSQLSYEVPSGSWITGVTFTGTSTRTFTAKFKQNTGSTETGTQQRIEDIKVKGDNTECATFRVTQEGQQPTYNIVAYTGSSTSSTATTISAAGGGFTLNVKTNDEGWTGSSNQNWATLGKTTGGNGTTAFTVTIDSYSDTTSSRVATLTFTTTHNAQCTFKITQNKYEPPTIVAYTGSSGSNTAATVNSATTSTPKTVALRVITTGQGWGVSSKPSWVTLSTSTGGEGTTSLTATCALNQTVNDRDGNIVFTGNTTGSSTIKITQRVQAYVSWNSTSVVTTTATTELSADGGNFTQSYYTSYSGTTFKLTKVSGDDILSSSAISNGTFSYTLKENTDTASTKQIVVGIYTGYTSSNILARITINQKKKGSTPTTRTLTINAANNFKFEVQNYAAFQDDEVEYLIATANSSSVSDCINFYGKLSTGTRVTFNAGGSITLNNQPTSQVTVTLYVVPYRGERDMRLIGYDWMNGVNFFSNHTTVISGNNSFTVTFDAGTSSITLASKNPNGEIRHD